MTTLRVDGWKGNWYIVKDGANGHGYLLKTGQILDWISEIVKQYPDVKERKKVVYFSSKEEAQDFLNNYLKGQNMSNYEERLAQCDKGIAALQSEKAKILKEKEAAEVKKFYLGTKFTDNYGGEYLLVRLIGFSDGLNDKVGLVRLNGFSKGFDWRHTAMLRIGSDNGYYVTKLPTTNPESFGLEKKYGV